MSLHHPKVLDLSPLVSIAPVIGDGELVAFGVGPDELIYVVVALKPLDYRQEIHGGPSFAKTIPKTPQHYRVVAMSGDRVCLDVRIEKEPFNIHFVQPLLNELLLVCARTHFKSRTNFEKNGRVYTRDGRFIREILLGDGIASVQTTTGGTIWTSYFDEGVFGNFGWRQPIGASGLVAFDGRGRKIHEFPTQTGLDPICDCYAMNVASEEDVYVCYYTGFPLVHVRAGQVEAAWRTRLSGCHVFAVGDGYALFSGGYKNPDSIHLLRLGSKGRITQLARYQLRGRRGSKLKANWSVGRGPCVYLLKDEHVYRLDVATALSSLAS